MYSVRLAKRGLREDTRDGNVWRNLGVGVEKTKYSGKVLE